MAEQTLAGSCLCGALKYRVSGEPARFFHCHCSRCRKASGTGHASNLFLENATLEWEGDTDLITHFKLPDAKRFARSFCSSCGSPVPIAVPGSGFVFVPAGTLDDEPSIKPQARIFLESRSAWSCTAEELPGYADYPK